MNANLYSLLEAGFARFANRPVFTLANGGQVTYGELAARVDATARRLQELGLTPGERITVQVEKSVGNVIVYLAALKCGAIFHPLNPAYTPSEVAFFIADAAPKVVVCDPARQDVVEAIARRHGVAHVFAMDSAGISPIVRRAGEASGHATLARTRDDIACLVYTSGTTGRSKGAMITHGNLASNALTLSRQWAFEEGDVLLHALPIFHVHGLHVALHTAFLNGCEIIWLDRFDVGEVIARLARATVMMGVPTFYTRLLAEPAFGRETCAGMRLFISGSAPLLAETHEAFAKRTGHVILERYGMTETGMIASNPYHGERLAGTVGYPLEGVSVRICDQRGNEVARGEPGVIEVKGPNVFAGYWNLPDKTREEFRADGYFITGDVATMSDDGRLTISGRAKDMIISGGFNVYPKEIEDVLDRLPQVGESAVIGIPHPDFGEGVVAVVTPACGSTPDEAAIIATARSRLAAFKAPKRVVTVNALPRNAMGKVQKAVLRERYAGLFRP